MQKQGEHQKKPSRRRYIIPAVILCIFAGCMYMILAYNAETKRREGEAIIRSEVAFWVLHKDPNDLTEKDFATLTYANIGYGNNIYDLKPLEKFTCLQSLFFGDESFRDDAPPLPKPIIPKWKFFLAKLRIIDLEKKDYFNLKPIGKLANLQNILFCGEKIFDIKPLAKLTGLKKLTLDNVRTTDLTPIKNLVNLEELDTWGSPISNLEPIKNLRNLKVLRLRYSAVPDLELIKGLNSLETLDICNTSISNLEPIKELKNLKTLYLHTNGNTLMEERLIDLRKAMPNLEIITNQW
jgi:hypothetical protein